MGTVMALSFLTALAGVAAVLLQRVWAGKPSCPLETEYVRKAKYYMEQNYSNYGLSREDVAHHVGLTPAYFGKLFKKQTGENFADFLNHHRLLQAKTLLETTEMNMAEITFSVGFSSQSYFGVLFKKKNRMSPKQYRLKYTRKRNGL